MSLMTGKELVLVKVKDVLPVHRGVGIFLEAEKKLFVIQVDVTAGYTLGMQHIGQISERPTTHDLITNFFAGFGIELVHTVITDMQDDVYYARITLSQQNELGRKIAEVDARPSDSFILSQNLKKPVFILRSLLERLEDVQEIYKELKKKYS